MRRAAWRPLRVARVRRLAPGPVGRRRALGPRCLPTMPQRVLVSLLLLPEAKQLRRRASEHCRLARHPPVLPLTHHRPRAGALSVCTSCRVMAARAALRRSHTDAHTRQIDAFECRDDLDVNGNWFNKSATTGDDGRGIPSLGFLRVVRGAKPTAAKPAPHRPRSDRTPVRCRAAPCRSSNHADPARAYLPGVQVWPLLARLADVRRLPEGVDAGASAFGAQQLAPPRVGARIPQGYSLALSRVASGGA